MKKLQNLKKFKKISLNNKGIAYVELIFLIPVFVMFFGLTIGLWASIHSGTLRSIAARHYAFEVLNNRTEFIYHRDTAVEGVGTKQYYKRNGKRIFANVKHQPVTVTPPDPIPARSWLNLFKGQGSAQDARLVKGKQTQSGCEKIEPALQFKIAYGICLDYNCGGDTDSQNRGFQDSGCRSE